MSYTQIRVNNLFDISVEILKQCRYDARTCAKSWDVRESLYWMIEGHYAGAVNGCHLSGCLADLFLSFKN